MLLCVCILKCSDLSVLGIWNLLFVVSSMMFVCSGVCMLVLLLMFSMKLLFVWCRFVMLWFGISV